MWSFLRQGPGFYRCLFGLALPLILQNLITTSLGFVDTFMVGLLGNVELSAVTAANTPIFLVQVIIFGLMSGLTVLASQYWGRGDIESINRCMGVAMYAGLAVSVTMAAVLFIAPVPVMGLVTDNRLLVELGAPYLRIVGMSYIFNSVSSVYVSMQRSVENPQLGLKIFGVSMLLNSFLNYCLIFGKLGAPALGITGAAIATLCSRVAEFIIVAVYALCNRRIPLNIRALLRPGTEFVHRFATYSAPVILNETLWGLGTSVMTAIMGHMSNSAEMLSAYAIMGNIDKFSTVSCSGLAAATAVIMGKHIGEGASKDKVYSLGLCLLTVSTLLGVVIGICLSLLLPTVFIPYLYPLFNLTKEATTIAVTMCVVYACVMPMRAFDFTNITGLLRAGGDSRMAAVLDLIPLWVVAIPLTALTALVLQAPIAVICLCIQSENLCKMPLGIIRLRSRKWINDITQGGEGT